MLSYLYNIAIYAKLWYVRTCKKNSKNSAPRFTKRSQVPSSPKFQRNAFYDKRLNGVSANLKLIGFREAGPGVLSFVKYRHWTPAVEAWIQTLGHVDVVVR